MNAPTPTSAPPSLDIAGERNTDGQNMPEEVRQAYEDGRRAGVREAAAFILTIRQIRDHPMFRGVFREVDGDGFADLMLTEMKLLRHVARALEPRLLDGASVKDREVADAEAWAAIGLEPDGTTPLSEPNTPEIERRAGGG